MLTIEYNGIVYTRVGHPVMDGKKGNGILFSLYKQKDAILTKLIVLEFYVGNMLMRTEYYLQQT